MTTAAPSVKTVLPGQGKVLSVLGDFITCKISGVETGGLYSLVETNTPPQAGPPLHAHHREDEGFYVLAGEFEIQVGDRTLRATPGTFAFLPREIPHRFQNVGPTTGKLLVTISPPGFEKFFEEGHNLSQQGPPQITEVVALGRKYDLEFILPGKEPS